MNEEQINVTMRQLIVRIVQGRTADLESEDRLNKFIEKLKPLKDSVGVDELTDIHEMNQEEFEKWLESITQSGHSETEIKQYLRELAEQIQGIDEGKMMSLTQKLQRIKKKERKFPWFKKIRR